MKKKKKNQSRKSITAVGAVVAAGLTPGIVTGAPALEPLSTDIELTAADAVSINGEMFEFEDLFAMNQGDSVPVDQLVVLYGSPKAIKKAMKEKKKKEKSQKAKEQDMIDSLNNEISIMEKQIEDLREQASFEAMRQDRIQRALQESYKLVYGPPRPLYTINSPQSLRRIISINKTEATNLVLDKVSGFVYEIAEEPISPTTNIIKDLKLNSQQLETFRERIYEELGVQITSDMMKQLGTVERIANFIVEAATPIDQED